MTIINGQTKKRTSRIKQTSIMYIDENNKINFINYKVECTICNRRLNYKFNKEDNSFTIDLCTNCTT